MLIAEDPFGPDATVEALYETPPDAELLTRLVGAGVTVAPLPDQDWISVSQEGLPPVRAGRFFVYGAHDAGVVPHGVIPIRSRRGWPSAPAITKPPRCAWRRCRDLARAARSRNVLDLGCGTGVLAIAAAKLWQRPVLATDIDPVAVEVARENARTNDVAPLVRPSIADGLDHPCDPRPARLMT